MVLLREHFSLRRAENVRSEVADAIGNVKYNVKYNSFWKSPRSALVTGVWLRASLIFVT